MSAEKEAIEEQKKEGKDVSALEANSLDEQARQYFRRMVRRSALCIHEAFGPQPNYGAANKHATRPIGMRQFSLSGSDSGISASPVTKVSGQALQMESDLFCVISIFTYPIFIPMSSIRCTMF